MDKLIEFVTAEGQSVLVEAAGNPSGPLTRGGSHGDVIERAQKTFEEAVGRVQPAVRAMVDQLTSMARRPSEVTVEFGIDLHAEAGAFIAQSGAKANFTVKLSWHDTTKP